MRTPLPCQTRFARTAVRAAVCAGAAAGLIALAPATGPAVATDEAPASAVAVSPEPSIQQLAGDAATRLDRFEATGDRQELRGYTRVRNETARRAALELGLAPTDMMIAWSEAPLGHQRAVLGALTQLGVPYRSATSEPGVGFDCSGLTSYAWRTAGVELLRRSGDQISDAVPVEQSEALAGDLVYYPGHVMLYLGVGDAIVHSITHGRDVELDTVSRSVRFGNPTA
jgi:hypothetical protein